jgi:hypothetical protein
MPRRHDDHLRAGPGGRPRLAARVLAGALACSGVLAGVLGSTSPVGAAITFTQKWQATLNDAGGPVAQSSPNIANLPGGPAVVVGDRTGWVWGLNLASGANVSGWPFGTGSVPVDATPSVSPTPGSNLSTVYASLGDVAQYTKGGYQAITAQGQNKWYQGVQNPPGVPFNAVVASMTVGQLQGSTGVVAGSTGQSMMAMNAGSGGVLNGFPWFQADSVFTTAAMADLYGDGRTEIVEGGDSTAGNAYGVQYWNGGHIRVLADTGNAGTGAPGGGLYCQYNTDQVVQGSPAVGRFLAGGAEGIVAGTGNFYPSASTTDDLLAVDSHCNLQWYTKLDGVTSSSPALADVAGNGQLEVIEGTNINNTNGSLWVLNGTNGSPIWHTAVAGAVIGSVVTADLTGSGYQDILVPTTAGVQVYDGSSHALVTTLGAGTGFQNSPLVTRDPNGTIGITIAGYNASNQGVVTHYEITGSNGARVDEHGSWPMFHHDPQLTGNADATYGVAAHVDEYVPDNAGGHQWNNYDQTITANGPDIQGRPGVVMSSQLANIHVYTQSSAGDLVEYVNDNANGHLWNAYDLSVFAGGGSPVAGTPNAVYNGLIHVYVRAASGDLTEYVNDNANGHLWNAYDLTVYGRGGWMVGTPSVVNTGLVHVYVQGANHDLTEYVNDNAGGHLWNAYDLGVYANNGSWVSGDPGAVYTGLVHVYVQSATGHLVEYVNDSASGHLWNAYDLSYFAGNGSPVAGTPGPIFTGPVHVYVRSSTGHLVEYVNDFAGGHQWNAYDLSYFAGSGVGVSGTPSPVYTGPIHVYARSAGGHLVEFVNDFAGGHQWNAYDLSYFAGNGQSLAADPGAGTLNGGIHIYAPGG